MSPPGNGGGGRKAAHHTTSQHTNPTPEASGHPNRTATSRPADHVIAAARQLFEERRRQESWPKIGLHLQPAQDFFARGVKHACRELWLYLSADGRQVAEQLVAAAEREAA